MLLQPYCIIGMFVCCLTSISLGSCRTLKTSRALWIQGNKKDDLTCRLTNTEHMSIVTILLYLQLATIEIPISIGI